MAMSGTWTALACLVVSSAAWAQNVADGRDVYGPCAACHGQHAEGGKGGEYPRLAGQPVSFLLNSLKQFQDRQRLNLPMFPYAEPRELSEQDMRDVAAFITAIELPTKMPPISPDAPALERLLAAERVLVVPKVKGDAEKGKALFRKNCGSCHGRSAQGKASRDAPRLVGQYPNYLERQFAAFKKGERAGGEDHPMNGVLDEVSPADFTDVLAWLTSIQDQAPEPEGSTDAGVAAPVTPPEKKP